MTQIARVPIMVADHLARHSDALLIERAIDRIALAELSRNAIGRGNLATRDSRYSIDRMLMQWIAGGHRNDPQALERDFGSVMTWLAEFTTMARALAGGSGWAILALNMCEHAYHLDSGAKAAGGPPAAGVCARMKTPYVRAARRDGLHR